MGDTNKHWRRWATRLGVVMQLPAEPAKTNNKDRSPQSKFETNIRNFVFVGNMDCVRIRNPLQNDHSVSIKAPFIEWSSYKAGFDRAPT